MPKRITKTGSATITQKDSSDDISDVIQRANEQSRGYADFWDWPLDRSLSELDVAQTLHNYILVVEPKYEGKISPAKKDPPDTILKTRQGATIGIEVSEIVNPHMVERHRYLKKEGQDCIFELARWSADSLARHVENALHRKDSKLRSIKNEFDEIIVCLFTDEYIVDIRMAQNAVVLCQLSLENIDRAFLMLSYTPNADESIFPYGYPVFEINTRSRLARTRAV